MLVACMFALSLTAQAVEVVEEVKNNGRQSAAKTSLRLAFGQRSSSALEIGNDICQLGVPVLNDNSRIESLALNNGMSRTDSETARSGITLEPRKEQTVSLGLAPITGVAEIYEHILVGGKEFVKNGNNSLFNGGVMGRTMRPKSLYDKLECVTAAQSTVGIKRNSIVYSKSRCEFKIAMSINNDLIGSARVDAFKRQFNHSETTVPVKPSSAQASAIRCLAFRFTSNECCNRARASSYVTFLASIT